MSHPRSLIDSIQALLVADYPEDRYRYVIESAIPGSRMFPDLLIRDRTTDAMCCAVEIGYTRPEKLTAYREVHRIPDVRWYAKDGHLHYSQKTIINEPPLITVGNAEPTQQISREEELIKRARAGEVLSCDQLSWLHWQNMQRFNRSGMVLFSEEEKDEWWERQYFHRTGERSKRRDQRATLEAMHRDDLEDARARRPVTFGAIHGIETDINFRIKHSVSFEEIQAFRLREALRRLDELPPEHLCRCSDHKKHRRQRLTKDFDLPRDEIIQRLMTIELRNVEAA